MTDTHDPYLNTVRRSLSEKKNKIRREKIQTIEKKPKGFFEKNIIISDYIYLPENLQNFFLLSIFILIPYLFGMLGILVIMGYEIFKETSTLTFDIFMLRWTIGYEMIAFILLILIVKSAFNFTKR